MSKLTWDNTGERKYYAGVKKGVLYPQVNSAYPTGVAWNGLTEVAESPSGAEPSPLYADDIKYLNLMSLEEFGFTINAYMFPDEFAACDGSAELVPGVKIGQQTRQAFGFSYVNTIGNDTDNTDYGYELHLVYGALASPSERTHTSINADPEAETMSWECTTTPVTIDGFKSTSHISIDSTKVDADKLAALEDILYGTDTEVARLPLPNEIASLMGATEG